MLKSIWWHLYLIIDSIFYLFLMNFFRLLYINNSAKRDKRYYLIAKKWAQNRFFSSGSKITVKNLPVSPKKSYIIIANHQSSFDIFVLMSFLPLQYFFLSKRLYFYLPLIGSAMRILKCVSINRKNKTTSIKSITRVATVLDKEKRSLIIFPEGTRSQTDEINRFKLGALTIAYLYYKLDTQRNRFIELLPIMLVNTRSIQAKGSLKVNKANVKMEMLQPIQLDAEKLGKAEEKKRLMNLIEQQFRNAYKSVQD